MKSQPHVTPTPLENIAPGTCVAFAGPDGITHVALAVPSSRTGARLPDLVVLTPNHPALNKGSGILSGSSMRGASMVTLSKAVAQVPTELHHLELSTPVRARGLALYRGTPCVAVN